MDPGRKKNVRTSILCRIARTFDFNVMTSLRLYHCHGWHLLLERLTASARPMRLKVLEIQSPVSACDDDYFIKEYRVIAKFMQTFTGLRELVVYARALGQDAMVLWEAMLNHRATLTRVVHHHRIPNLRTPANPFLDSAALSFSIPDHMYDDLIIHDDLDESSANVHDDRNVDEAPDRSSEPLEHIDLVSLGLCCPPRWVVRYMHALEVQQGKLLLTRQ